MVFVNGYGKTIMNRTKIDLNTFQVTGISEIIVEEGLIVNTLSFSPDDTIATLSGGPLRRTNLYTIHPDGSGMRRLTNDRFRNINPIFTPSGNRLIFVSNRSGSYDIWEIGIDGGGLKQLTEGWNTFLPPIKRPGTGDYLIGHTDREQWYVLPPDAERANLETLKPMPKVDEENQDWMLPGICTSDGYHVVGTVFLSLIHI